MGNPTDNPILFPETFMYESNFDDNFRKMAPRRRRDDRMTPNDPITKEQKSVAKWLRRNVPTKKTKFMHSHVVEYFSGTNAVDMLLENSPWAKKNVKDPENQLYFEFREHCVEFLDELLKHKMFHRAKKIPVDRDMLKKKKKSKDNEETDDGTYFK